MYNRPMRQTSNLRNNGALWVAILLDVAILWVNYTNLQYNRLQVLQSRRVADGLHTLNQSNFIVEINNKLREEKTNGT